MADGKLTYDIDFNVNTSKISEAIASAVSRASSLTYSTPTPTNYMDLSVMNLADRVGAGWGFYDRVRNNLGIGSEFFQEQGVNSLSEFAALATSQKYGYTPSTTQMIINGAVAAALRSSKKKPDMQWKFEMESMTNDVRAAQREQAKSSLAYEYAQQGRMFANAAAMATTPEAQRRLLGAASSRYASIASRTLVESGAVSPEDAAIALSTAAELSSIGSGIKTQAQIAAQKDKEYDLMEAAVAKKSAEEDAAWATRGYSEAQKAREMEKGFRAMEASSATEKSYNPNTDMSATSNTIRASIAAANRYISRARGFEAGSSGRTAMLQLAGGAIAGISPQSMGRAGVAAKEIEEFTIAVNNAKNSINELSQVGGEAASLWSTIVGDGSGIVNLAVRGVGIATEVMQGRTSWLADTRAPYQTRRDVRQGWAMKYGSEAMGAGAGLGAAIGTAIAPGIGTVVGGLIGAAPGAVATLLGTHYADEKKIADSYMSRASDMMKWRNLYGEGVSYNYAQMVEGTGYMSQSQVLQMNQAADMLPGALAFGAVDERTMMALSYMPNYYAALLEGRSTEELMAAYRNDLMGLPPQFRQYISSLLPGVSEDTRAFASSNEYGQVANSIPALRGYDANQYKMAPGLMVDLTEISRRNVEGVNTNMTNELAKRTHAEMVGDPGVVPRWIRNTEGNVLTSPFGLALGTLGRTLGIWDRDTSGVASEPHPDVVDLSKAKFGDIVIMIDGREIYREGYSLEADYKRTNQSYVVGG